MDMNNIVLDDTPVASDQQEQEAIAEEETEADTDTEETTPAAGEMPAEEGTSEEAA